MGTLSVLHLITRANGPDVGLLPGIAQPEPVLAGMRADGTDHTPHECGQQIQNTPLAGRYRVIAEAPERNEGTNESVLPGK